MMPRRKKSTVGGHLIEARALADDVRALLERLDLTAMITDRGGNPLAATPLAEKTLHANAFVARRVVEVRLRGHALCVAVPAEDTQGEPKALTPRQLAVVRLVADGLRNREIAERLGISLHTVRRHVEALLVRLKVPTRAAAALLLQHQILGMPAPAPGRGRAS